MKKTKNESSETNNDENDETIALRGWRGDEKEDDDFETDGLGIIPIFFFEENNNAFFGEDDKRRGVGRGDFRRGRDGARENGEAGERYAREKEEESKGDDDERS